MKLASRNSIRALLIALTICVTVLKMISAQHFSSFPRRLRPTTGPARMLLFEPGRGTEIVSRQIRPVPYRPSPPVVRLFVPERGSPARASPREEESEIFRVRKREKEADILQPRFVLFDLQDNEVSPQEEETTVALQLRSYTTTCPKLRDTVELRCETQTNTTEPLVSNNNNS